jgi:hypothetical protein
MSVMFQQIEVHTAEPLVPGPNHLEAKLNIAKMKKYKSPSSDQIPEVIIKARSETLVCVIRSLLQNELTCFRITHTNVSLDC